MGAENSDALSTYDMELQRALSALISTLYDGGYRYFYTALREGFDLIAAEMVKMMKMRGTLKDARLVAVITTEDQAINYSSDNLTQFHDLFAGADHPYMIGRQFSGSKLVIEDEFIDKCDLIVCWDDGEDPNLTFTLNKARETKRRIINVLDLNREE